MITKEDLEFVFELSKKIADTHNEYGNNDCSIKLEHHGGKDYWLHDDLKKFCEIIQLWPKDLFVLNNEVVAKEYKQRGSRKNHSYLWVFKKKMW